MCSATMILVRKAMTVYSVKVVTKNSSKQKIQAIHKTMVPYLDAENPKSQRKENV